MIVYGTVRPETIEKMYPTAYSKEPAAEDDPVFDCLTDEEIDTFNTYLAADDMRTAFGNSDFMHIYSKIVGSRIPDDILDMMEE